MRVVRAYMVRHGVPKRFHADQGSTFESAEFKEFCAKWGIQFSDNSPKHPQGNAIAEAHVKKAKHIITTAADEDEFADALIALMQTPIAPGQPSPAQLHFGRNLRDTLHPEVRKSDQGWQEHKEWRMRKNEKEKEYYDRGTKVLCELEKGDSVLVWHKEEWQRGVITEKLARPRSYEVQITKTGRKLQRNRVQIRKVDPEMSEQREKNLKPSSFFQLAVPVPVLSRAIPVIDPQRRPTAAYDPDQEENEDMDEAETEPEDVPDTLSGQATPDSVHESEGSEAAESEYDDALDESSADEDDPSTPVVQTRAGRRVRPPDRYTP